jgi:hypothetical protein
LNLARRNDKAKIQKSSKYVQTNITQVFGVQCASKENPLKIISQLVCPRLYY